jgi:hypothetical protein
MLSNGQLKVFPEAAHTVHYSHPLEFAHVAGKFFTDVEQDAWNAMRAV